MVSLQDLDYLLALLGASTTAEGVGHLVVQFWDFMSYSLKSYRQGAAKEAKLFKGLQRLIEVNDCAGLQCSRSDRKGPSTFRQCTWTLGDGVFIGMTCCKQWLQEANTQLLEQKHRIDLNSNTEEASTS